MNTLERLLLGAIAGLVSVLSKFLAHDYDNIANNFANLTADQILNYQVGYSILTPILIILGAFIAWISDESNKLKIVAMAISAPALITTWAGGDKPTRQAANAQAMFSAFAQPGLSSPAPRAATPTADPSKISDVGAATRIQQGIGIFFGIGKEAPRYRVVVNSFDDIAMARQQADTINRQHPELAASVLRSKDPAQTHQVVLGEAVAYSQATRLQQLANLKGLTGTQLQDAKP